MSNINKSKNESKSQRETPIYPKGSVVSNINKSKNESKSQRVLGLFTSVYVVSNINKSKNESKSQPYYKKGKQVKYCVKYQ